MRVIVLSALGLAACSDQDLVKSDDTAGEDSGAGRSACPPYAGLDAAGTRWRWTFETADSAGSREDTLVEAGVAPVLSRVQEGGGEGWSTTSELELRYRCDADGAWLVGQSYHSSNTTTSGTFEDTGTMAWDPGWLVVPWGFDNASTWEVAFTITTESERYGTTEASWSGSYMVENTETVETGVGQVEALEAVGAGDAGEGATWMDQSLRHPEMGLVSDGGTFYLAEYEAG